MLLKDQKSRSIVVIAVSGGLIFAGILMVVFAWQTPQEQRLLKEQVDTLDKWAEHLEKVTDKNSLDELQPVLAELSKKMTRLSEEFNALPAERKQAATNLFSDKMLQVTTRLTAAKKHAAQAAKPG